MGLQKIESSTFSFVKPIHLSGSFTLGGIVLSSEILNISVGRLVKVYMGHYPSQVQNISFRELAP
jgi:hypothetical protein